MKPTEMIEDVEHEDVTVNHYAYTNKKESSETPDITQVIDEEVNKSTVQENTKVNFDDFEDAAEEPIKETVKDPVKKDDANPLQVDQDNAKSKQSAVTRLMKPGMLILFYNSVAGRTGKIINPKNPDCLKFDKKDEDDIGILLEETVKEEDWRGFPTKWLLLIIVGMIIISKIFAWNKPKEVEGTKILEIEAGYKKTIDAMQQGLDEMKKQNELLMAMIEKKSGNHHALSKVEGPAKIFKGYDLSKISFTDKGALIDPDMKGKKGYTDEGKKQGIPSNEEKEVKKQWMLYKEYHKEEIEAHDFEEVA